MMVWDKAYTRAMRDIFRKHRADLDVRCLFVDAIMNETPWQMWNLETGKPTEGAETLEAMAVLDEAFETDAASWDHPGLLHLYVHLIEMSPFPQKALRAGDRLRELVPDSGHLVHMPTHIDVLCGNYNDVMRWNQKAVAADRKFVERERRDELLHALPRPQSSLRDLRRDVPGPVHAGHRGGAGADRHHARGAAQDPVAADGRLPRALPLDEAARADPLRQVARDHRPGSCPRTATSTARPWP